MQNALNIRCYPHPSRCSLSNHWVAVAQVEVERRVGAFEPRRALAFATVRVPELNVAVSLWAHLNLAKLAFATIVVPFVARIALAC